MAFNLGASSPQSDLIWYIHVYSWFLLVAGLWTLSLYDTAIEADCDLDQSQSVAGRVSRDHDPGSEGLGSVYAGYCAKIGVGEGNFNQDNL